MPSWTTSWRRRHHGDPGRRALGAVLLVVAAVTAAQLVTAADGVADSPAPVDPPSRLVEQDPCAPTAPVADDTARCFAVERVPTSTDDGTAVPYAAGRPVGGITVPQLQTMYGVTGRTPPVGTTVAVVVAYDDPAAESNLAAFRSYWGLSACAAASGCLEVVDQRGKPISSSNHPATGNNGWRLESALDLQAVSAVCPTCRLLLVEADTARITDLAAATAAAGRLGAPIISNSFGATESASQLRVADAWNQPGVAIFAATGDNGWENFSSGDSSQRGYANFPASSPTVTAVGGTSATIAANGSITSEAAWTGSGSSCSILESRPSWQQAYFNSQRINPDPYENPTFFGCTLPGSNGANPARAVADLSTIADPSRPGFPVFVDGGWAVGGGTSLSAPLMAGLQALAGPRGTGTDVAQVAYGLGTGRGPSATASQFTDITAGSNGGIATCYGEPICTSMPGWDGPTGLGAVRSTQVFLPLLRLGSSSVASGGQLSVSGANYLPNEQVSITVGSGPSATLSADATGAISGTIEVPGGATHGSNTVTSRGALSGFTTTLPIAITGGFLSVSTTPSAPLSVVPVEAIGFSPGEVVDLVVGDVKTSVTVSSSGRATGTVTIPADAEVGAPLLATGRTSGITASAILPVLAVGITPTSVRADAGQAVTLTVSGFGVGETVKVTTGSPGASDSSSGSVVGSGVADAEGSARISATVPTAASAGRVLPLVVTGARTARTALSLVRVNATGTPGPDAPTVLSAVPLATGTGTVIGVRAAPGSPVTVYASDGSSVVIPAAAISGAGDAFATFTQLATGRPYTFVAVSNGSAADSNASGASNAVTASTDNGAGDLTPVGPVRRYDSRTSDGPLGPASSRQLCLAGTAGVPSTGVSAAVLSITATDATDTSFLTVWPDGETRPTVANANFVAGQTKASLAKVKLGTNGCIGVYNNKGTTNVVVDVVGFYASDSGVFAHNVSYSSLTEPARTLDTRQLPYSRLREGAGTMTASVRTGIDGRSTGVPDDATSVELNVQAVQSSATSFLTVWPTGAAGGRPLVSNAQFAPGAPTSTAVVSGVGTDGTVSIYVNGGTDVIVDIIGFYSPSADGRFVPISPRRYADTRVTGNPLGAASLRSVPVAGAPAMDGSIQVPLSATAASLQLISTDNSSDTYLTAFADTGVQPFVTNLLPQKPQGLYDNLALSALGIQTGAAAVYNNVGTINVIVDVQGYYRSASGP